VQQGFFQSHGAAVAVVTATFLGWALLEAAASARERIQTAVPADAGLPARIRVALSALLETTTGRTTGSSSTDRGTKSIVIGAMAAAIVLGWWVARAVPGAGLPGSGWVWLGIGVTLMWLGIGLRIWAIVVLGRFLRRVVVIQEGHRVVRNGPYRLVRHPAYAGNLLAVAGLGVALDNWLTLVILVIVPFLGHLPRIRVEEAELERGLGEAYPSYEARTRRLVPGVW
jgi:protein-S-isoprenylcysteine O-methyltransferase Ste14